MKKIHALVFLGSLVLTVGLLVKFYAYPRLAVIPADLDSSLTTENPSGAAATFFSIPDLEERSAPLSNSTHARVDPVASKQATRATGRDVLVIRSYACTDLATVACNTVRYPLQATLSAEAVDRSTGEPVAWKDSSITTGGKTRTNVAFEGLTVKFPFNTQQTSYPIWNADLNRAVPARYVGRETLHGLKVYTFRAVVAPTKVADLDLPGSVVGRPEPSLRAAQMTSSSTTYYVEPETGVIISAVSTQDGYATVDGTKVLTTIKGTFVATDATIEKTADEYRGLATQLFVLRVLGPSVSILLGLLCLTTAGLLLARRRRGRGDSGVASARDVSPVTRETTPQNA